MRSRRSILTSAALAVSVVFGPAAYAQGRKLGGNRPTQKRPERPERPVKPLKRTPLDEFERLPPEDQRKALDRLPPPQRQRLQDRLQRFNQLPADQQRSLKTMYSRLNELPANRQDVVRKSMNRFLQEPPERQQAMREELKGLGSMPAADRPVRLESPDFRTRFNRKEQEIVRDMAELLPEEFL